MNQEMTKEIILFKDTNNNRESFCRFITEDIIPQISALGPSSLKVSITQYPPPRLSVIPFSKTAMACISVTGVRLESANILSAPHFYGVYQVTEALPVRYQINWARNTPTPGCCLLTLFNRKKNLSDNSFYDRWHNGHTPLSLKIHPLWNYNRNVVNNTISGQAFEGIVEEQVRQPNQLLNPVHFFGGFFMMGINMVRTLLDTKSFIDYRSMETYYAKETWIIIPQ